MDGSYTDSGTLDKGSDHDKLRLNLKNLNNVMRQESGVATRWYELGVELLDSNTAVLDVIQSEHQSDNVRCSKMLKTWLEMKPDASWSQLVTALNNIGLRTAADNVKMSELSKKGSVNRQLTNLTITNCNTPEKASTEFGLLLIEILNVLKQNESDNLEKLQIISSTLTVKDSSGVRIFSDSELEDIQSCTSIKTLLINKLRHCYRWDDYSMLTVFMSSLNAGKCLKLLHLFEIKIYSQIKLQQICEQLPQESSTVPEDYKKMIAIVDKTFSSITKEEYDELKYFIADHCGVEPCVISPFLKARPFFSVAIEWCIPVNAVSCMIETARANTHKFCKETFKYLNISSTVIFDYRKNKSDCDQLLQAIWSWDVATVETLINTRYIDVNTVNEDGSTPLHAAACTGNCQMIETLIKLGANMNPATSGWTPLHEAVHKNRVQAVELLIKFEANINAVTKDGWTPLHDAAHEGHPQAVEALIKSENIDINAAIYNGWTPLHAASNWNHIEVVKLLIKSGANVNIAQHEDGWTPLHCASRYGNVEIAKMLITAGSNINSISKGGDLPLHLASSNGHTEVVKILVKAGAEIGISNKKNRLPIQEALNCKQHHVVRYFVREAEMDLTVLDQVTRHKIRILMKGRSHGHLAYEYDSDQHSDANSSASSGHESSDTEEE